MTFSRILAIMSVIASAHVLSATLLMGTAGAADLSPQFDVPVTVNPDSSGAGNLSAVDCPSTTMCVAVGVDGSAAGQAIYSVGTETDGLWAWSTSVVIAPDASGGGRLLGISCASSSDCVAIGVDDNVQAIYTSGYESGGVWTWSTSGVIPSDGSGDGILRNLSCSSSTSCVAVGQDGANPRQAIFTSGTESGGAWTWSTSTIVPPDASGEGTLSSVSCANATSCVAVGQDGANPRQAIYSSGIESGGVWTWTALAVISPDTWGGGELNSVSCASTTSCVAVGHDNISVSQGIFTSGTESGGVWTWSTSTDLTPNSLNNAVSLSSVSCVNTTSCVAVGEIDANSISSLNTEAIYSSGTESGGVWTWSERNDVTPDSSSSARFEAVSCTSTALCVAVGDDGNAQAVYDSYTQAPATPSVGTALSGNASVMVSWSLPPVFDGYATGYTVRALDLTTSVETTNDCPGSLTSTSDSCLVTGLNNGDTYTFSVAAINAFGMSAYSIESNQTDPFAGLPPSPSIVTPSGFGSGTFNDVSCASTTSCVAVGSDGNHHEIYSEGSETAGTWSWSAVAYVTADSTGGGGFSSVSCASVASCVAVGQDNSGSPVFSEGTMSGGTWTWTTASAAGNATGTLSSVDCPTTTTCIAVGSDNHATILFGTKTGATWDWSVETVAGPPASNFDGLSSVSCASSTACVAAGTTSPTSQGIVSAGTESGGVWSWTPLTEVTSPNVGGFVSVSCTSPTSCLAVGTPAAGTGSFYSAATESGGAWTWTSPTQLPPEELDNGYSGVSGVSCTSSQCVVVGQGQDAYATMSQQYFYTGTESGGVWSWSQPNEVIPDASGGGRLNAVDCSGVISCVAVGSDSQSQATFDAWTVVLPSVPSAPLDVIATKSNLSATVNWTAGYDGGSAISGYTVNVRNTTTSTTTLDACPKSQVSPSTACTLTGLVNGDAYTFTVAAINVVGVGSSSQSSNPVTPSSTVPATPIIGGAIAGYDSATVDWIAPASNGGSAITGYVVTTVDESTSTARTNSCPTSETSVETTCTVASLNSEDEYVFDVAAINANGPGPYSPFSNTLFPLAAKTAQNRLVITSRSGHFGTPLLLTASGGSGLGMLSFSAKNGTAANCSVTSNHLTSKSAGTCVVTATKAADAVYDVASSAPTTITLSLPAVPAKVTIAFASNQKALNSKAKADLKRLAKRLVAGAKLTVIGYAKGQPTLARNRANVVAHYLKTMVRITVTLKVVFNSWSNKVIVTTVKE